MSTLIAGLVLFLGAHSVRIWGENLRTDIIERLGPMAWKGLYAVVSLAGLYLVVQGYVEARTDSGTLWTPAPWLVHLGALLNLPAFILLIAAYVPGNGIASRLGHPMTLGVKLWALAHLLANGDLVSVIVFGSVLLWSVLLFRNVRRRPQDKNIFRGGREPSLAATLATVLIGAGAWVWFAFVGHAMLFGVAPFAG